MDWIRENKIMQAWLVLTIALFFGAMLAGVQIKLGPTIEKNRRNETLEKVPALVLGKEGADKMAAENRPPLITPSTITVDKIGRKVYYNVYAVRDKGELKGYGIKTNGQGYADRIELLFGLNPTLDKITGLFILEQKETPGLGNKIVTDEWRSQFVDIPSFPALKVIKGKASTSGEIEAITGATISSRAVTDIINSAVSDLHQPLMNAKDN
ncbi:MAG: FMN-binding protein [Desulfobacteraceae bacterium]|nr:FMN-binding protein [Desulfobacteraceae bacterium]MBU4055240.1 FMN-binding protein [Pseudomonadota bacterium]